MMSSTSKFRSMSCDTMVAMGSVTATGRTLFAKNSDRHPNEAQYLTPVASAQYSVGETLQCTYVAIPQVEQTWGIIGSRPWWMWGFEHGVNEHGVAVGNEALWSREAASTEPGLLGMDLVRLVLERARTAVEGVDVLTALLEQHGQSGSTNLMFTESYQNGFLIADPNDAWIIETSGHHWAAKQVDGVASISNTYSVGSDYDRISADAQSFAERHGWFDGASGEKFDFGLAFADPDLPFLPTCTARLRRSGTMLGELRDDRKLTIEDMMLVLRDDHATASDTSIWRPETHGESSLCMHAQDLNGSETAASVVADLSHDPLLLVSLSSPCLSPFVPIWFGEALVPWQQPQDSRETDLDDWWQTEMMQRMVERDHEKLGAIAAPIIQAADANTLAAIRGFSPARFTLAERNEFTRQALKRRSQVVVELENIARDGIHTALTDSRTEHFAQLDALIRATTEADATVIRGIR